MMIETAALKIAEGIKRQVPEHKSSVNVLKHAIAIVLNIVLIISFTLIASSITGNTKQALTALLGFALLRQFSGGVHLKTGAWCIIVTTVLFTGISFIELPVLYIQIFNIISLLLVGIFAPSRIEKQSRIPKVHYSKLRVISSLIVVSNILIQSPTLAVCFFIQALSLIHWKGGELHDTDQ
ncbi:accessory gene regulator B family protein [Paenibacillus sp. N3/727]|uniref:accessory gene regulator ArgB-like protein n=1 Tax=Paenibacillus sp. N3/727 TaxID=2925845 RepID=UPI001F5339D9|nr:accessory gene regulator B family protein [Paenibacillus sp. N3/727]UNK20179.1 accessory gene regulator B family protein [Paenibacillus sp. N3/727]